MDILEYPELSHDVGPDCGYTVESYCGWELIETSSVRSQEQAEELAIHMLTASRADRVMVVDGDSNEIVSVW